MIEHSSEGRLSSKCDLYLDGGVVVTLDEARTVIDEGAVAISGQRILAVGPSAELRSYRSDAGRVIDCAGKVLMPGLTDGHTHLFQILGRGLGDGLSLVPWLQEFMFPYSKAMTSENGSRRSPTRSTSSSSLRHHDSGRQPLRAN